MQKELFPKQLYTDNLEEEAKFGYVDNEGRWAIEPRFEVAQEFAKGFARAKMHNGK